MNYIYYSAATGAARCRRLLLPGWSARQDSHASSGLFDSSLAYDKNYIIPHNLVRIATTTVTEAPEVLTDDHSRPINSSKY